MKKLIWVVALIFLASVLFSGLALAQEKKAEEQAKAPKKPAGHAFIGALKCKPCHNSEAKGKQYDKWAASKHANAYKTLLSEQSKKIAGDLKIADATKSEKCLKCHIAGAGVDKKFLGEKYSMEEGVTCEACHGAGGDYWTMKVMKDHKLAMEAGLLMVTKETCLKCHNKDSPTFKEFKYEEALKVIDHKYPKK